jgi:integrase
VNVNRKLTNPIHDVSIPRAKEPDETYAYSLDEVKKMLPVLAEPARTVVLTAALTGLRKGEMCSLCWEDCDGTELRVNRSMWNGISNPPKTRRSAAPVPVVKELADALEDHRQRMGKLAVGPIFQAGNGKRLNLDNLARRVIQPMLTVSKVAWHGWHAFRRGLATNLHGLRVDDKTIQAILRHSNISLIMNVYVKSLAASGVNAMDLLGAELRKETCNDFTTNGTTLPN